MDKAVVSIKKLLSAADRRVEEFVVELENSLAGRLWTEKLPASSKIGKTKPPPG